MKKINSKKAILLAAGGKLALVPGLASAQGGKDDDMVPADPAPQLKLNQVAVPFDAFIPPFNDADTMADGSMFEDELEGYESTGVIFVGEIDGHARMDFIISNIRNDKPVDVFLVMGTELAADAEGDMFPGLAPTNFQGPNGRIRAGNPKPDSAGPDFAEPKPTPINAGPVIVDRNTREVELDNLHVQLETLINSDASEKEIEKVEKELKHVERQLMKNAPQKGGDWSGMGWKPKTGATPSLPVHGGEICVDIANNMEIIAAVRITPKQPIMAQEFSLGKAVEPHFTSTIISVNLLKEKLLEFKNQEVFFQAAVIPANDQRDLSEVLADAGQVSECDRYLISNVIEADEEYMIEANDGSKEGGDYSDEYDDSGEIIIDEGSETLDNSSKAA